jgi:Tfp pilus assembly protein PilO
MTSILLAVALIGAAAAGYWYLALAPKREQIAKLDADIAAKQAQVAQAEAMANDSEAARQAYRRNYATVVRLGKAVPADEDVRSLVVQLDTSAKHSKVDFSSIALTSAGASPGAASTPSPAGFVTQPFTFTFQGTFFRLSDFFSQLDRFVQVDGDAIDANGRLLHIDRFSLQADDKDSRVLKADVGATSYQLPKGQGLTAGATAQSPAASTTATASPTPGGGSNPSTTTATTGVAG